MTTDTSTSVTPAWHAMPADAVLVSLQTSPEGLSETEAAARLQQYGTNHLPEPPPPHPLRRFLLQFRNVLIYVLLASATITALLDHLADTLVILAVVIVNAIIGFVQEGKAEQAMDAIRRMLAPTASVLRHGERHQIPAEQLVPGDIVHLEAGDRVPADLRLIQANSLTIQESILTGESVAVEKNTTVAKTDAVLGDRKCMAYSGTLVTGGHARGTVIATGTRTEVGRIGSLLTDVQTLETPLLVQMARFSKWLTGIILVVALLLLGFGNLVMHMEFTELFMVVVGLSVAAIPEGLPAVLTITLAVGVQAMARRNAIVRRLPAIEAIGSVSVICTDKTGTLTVNEMTVSSVVGAGIVCHVSGAGYAPEGEFFDDGRPFDPLQDEVISTLLQTAALCNDASLHHQAPDWTIHGDPMEGALLVLARKAGLDPALLKRDWPRTDAIPFDANHRFMATLNHSHDGRARILIKGAPERLFGMCRQQLAADGRSVPLDAGYWQAQVDAIAAAGQRVLALAMRPVPAGHTVLSFSDVEQELTLLGLVGLLDPPRPEAIDAIAECHAAGIRVKMITGDHAVTAAAIGRQIGLADTDRVLTGSELEQMDDQALVEAARTVNIFARTSPVHKLRLVMALQSLGEVVAMTGDGVNDAPALKRADAGIAMGRGGSEAAKEAAELVLADDNFASIVAAVREGRTVYDNLKKVISWTLPTNAGEATTIIVAILLGMTLPVTPIQILWVNLITAATLGIALAFEPTEAGTMRRPPRPRGEALLTPVLVWYCVYVSLLFVCGVFGIFKYAISSGYSIELARTMAVNTLVVMEIFNLFFIRNIYGTSLTLKAVSGTPTVWITVLIITIAQFAITYVPVMQRVFDTRAVPFNDGLLIVGVGVLLFVMVEAEKQVRLRLISGRSGSGNWTPAG